MPPSFRMPTSGLALALGLASAPAIGFAASPCSFEQSYPEVNALDIVEGRLVATLGGRFAPGDNGAPGIRVALGEDGAWEILSDADASPARDAAAAACPAAPVDEDWIRSEGMNPSARQTCC